ncbi:MAG: protein kinase domain-containing protein [Gemmatimonadales bacterium]
MTQSLLERVQCALGNRYEVDREVSAAEGTGLFLASDRSLKRTVAIKAMDRAAAGDALAHRFENEARSLAGMSHPNIVAIHDLGERNGLLYYVRDFPAGEPLSERIARCVLSPSEAVRLGLDLLSAIGAAHRRGVTHLDIQPENIVVLPDGFVLTGLGVTAPPDSGDDLYHTGLILYQALTGRVWPGAQSPRLKRWAGVPARLRAPLSRALDANPAKRWPDAPSFARELKDASTRSRVRGRVLGATIAVGLLLAVSAWWPARAARAPAPIPRELAIVPFESADGGNDGRDLAHLLQLNLDNLPGLSLTSARRVNQWSDRRGRASVAGETAQAARELRAHWVTHGVVEHQGDSLRVRVTLYEGGGRVTPLPEVRSHQADLGGLSDTLALKLVRSIAPQLAGSYRVVGDLGNEPLPALRQFVQGDEAFDRDQWARAEQHFEAALALDSSFALAAWRLANVRVLRRVPATDLEPLYQRPGARLRPLDALLIAALRQPNIAERLRQLELAIARFPEDAYARWVYAEEVFHRGPLTGRTLADGARAMGDAIAQDSLLALAYDHLVCARIRQGERERARELLALRQGITSDPSPGDPDVLALSRLAYDERFAPARAGLKHRLLSWTADSVQLDGVARLFRTGVSWFDIPESQLALGGVLLTTGTPDRERRASAHVGRALALMTLGRPAEATAELDVGLNLLDNREAALEQAEWRVALRGFGLPVAGSGKVWHSRLVAMAGDSQLGHRAEWVLALASYFISETGALERWRARLQSRGPIARDLEHFARAMTLASGKQWKEALALSDSLDTAMNATRPADPFARSAFHLLRGDWSLALGDTARAEREWRWHENSDIVGWPTGFPQAGEIDGMLGVLARLRRSRLLLRPAASAVERKYGCAMAGRVVELWSGAESVMNPLLEEARTLSRSCAT